MSIYGYEWQGDNLILAREALFYTFIEYYRAKFGTDPLLESLKQIADIISWNLWQMDGLKGVIPGCKNKDIHSHTGRYALIKDWKENKVLTFVSLLKQK